MGIDCNGQCYFLSYRVLYSLPMYQRRVPHVTGHFEGEWEKGVHGLLSQAEDILKWPLFSL
jgi:hypothetical protein